MHEDRFPQALIRDLHVEVAFERLLEVFELFPEPHDLLFAVLLGETQDLEEGGVHFVLPVVI